MVNNKRERERERTKKNLKLAASLVCHAPLYTKKENTINYIHKGIYEYGHECPRNHGAYNK